MKRTLFVAALVDRRRAWMWWNVALVLTVVMIAASFGAIEGQEALNESFEDIPDSLRVLMGIDAELTLTSPAGYLNSQWFANMLPILLSIFGIGLAARLLAGEEGEGRLELLLAHPIGRLRVLGQRAAAAFLLLLGVFVVPTVVLVVAAPGFGMDGVGLSEIAAASTSGWLLALFHSAVTFGVGAWTGRRSIAIAVGAAATGAGFLLQSLASVSATVRPLRWLTPWYWFFDARPIVDGWGPLLVPSVAVLGLCALAVGAGAARFRTRDIGAGS